MVYTTIDERSGREKVHTHTMVVNAFNVKQAYERIEDSLKTMLVPFETKEVIQTNILEVFRHQDSTGSGVPKRQMGLFDKPAYEMLDTEMVDRN